MFVIKKMIGGLLMPLPLFGLFACLMLLLAFKGRKSALFLSTLSLIVLLALSTPFIANLIIQNNEPASLVFDTLKHPKIDKIVVLGRVDLCGLKFVQSRGDLIAARGL